MTEERQRWKRLGLPCENCRARKKRCDGTRPSCLACEKRGISASCEYISVLKQKKPRTKLSSSTPTSHNTQENHFVQRQTGAGRTSELTATIRTASDGIATVALQDDGTAYGLSSTKAFLRHILSEDELTAGIDDDTVANQPGVDASHKRHTTNDSAPTPPSREICDNCLSCYWEYVWPVFPLVFRPTIEARYDQLFDQLFSPVPSNDMEVDISITTLLLILALGLRFCMLIPADRRDALRADLYQRSRTSFRYDILDTNSLSIIQMLLLSAVYLQSAPYANRSWNTVGLAVRMAESLGLHQDSFGGENASLLDKEMSRRIWYCCTNIDRLTALAFGRPAMTKYKHNVPAPSMADDSELSADADLRPTLKNQYGTKTFFIASNKLLNLLPEISDLYNTIEREAASEREDESIKYSTLAKILEVNRQLDQVAKELPEHLKMTRSASLVEHTNQVKLQRSVLIGRFLLMRLWLHRPLLARSIKARANSDLQEEPSLDDQIIQKCCVTAVNTACKMAHLLHGNLNTLYRSSDTPNVYFGFVAGLVILAFQQCNFQTAYGEIDDIELSLDRCIEVMAYYKEQNSSARQAHKVLQIVRHKQHKRNPVAIDANHDTETPADSNYSNTSDERININDVFMADQFPMDWFGGPMVQYDSFLC